MAPETMTLGMKIGMEISGVMLILGIFMTFLFIFATILLLCRKGMKSPKRVSTIEENFQYYCASFLMLLTAALLFLGSIAVKIHMWMWTAR